MRSAIVEQICRGATSETAARARALVDGHGNIATQLVAAGFAPARVLEVCCAVSEIPACDIAWIREPKLVLDGVDRALCRQLEAAPVARVKGRLCIAYSDPETAQQHDALGLPPHQPYLANPVQLQRALDLLRADDGDDDGDDKTSTVDIMGETPEMRAVREALEDGTGTVPTAGETSDMRAVRDALADDPSSLVALDDDEVAPAPKPANKPTARPAAADTNVDEALDGFLGSTKPPVAPKPLPPPMAAAAPPPKKEKPKLPTSGARVAEASAPPHAAAGGGPDQQITAARKGGFNISHAPLGAPGKARVIESLDPEIAAPVGPKAKATAKAEKATEKAAAKNTGKAAGKAAAGPPSKGAPAGPPSETEPEPRDLIADLLVHKKPIAAALAVIVLIFVVAVSVSSGGGNEKALPTKLAAAEKLLKHQNDLTATGKLEADDMVAIKILTSSILLGPDAPGARDAYLERARRYHRVGDRAGAAQDIADLKKRADVEPILGELKSIVDEFDRSKKR